MVVACATPPKPVTQAAESVMPRPVSKPATLNVVTANLHVGAGADAFSQDSIPESQVLSNLERAVAILEKEKPDVFFLQEIDFRSRRTSYVDQEAWLVERTGYVASHAYTFDTRSMPPATVPTALRDCLFGLLVLTRETPDEVRIVELPNPPEQGTGAMDEKRVLLFVRLTLPDGNRVVVANTHLNHISRQARLEQLEVIAGELEPESAWILGGDFNEPWPFPKSLSQAWQKRHDWLEWKPGFAPWFRKLGVLWPEFEALPTYPAKDPVVTIDHVFAAGRASVIGRKRLDSEGSSDHHFVQARILVQPEEGEGEVQ